MTNRFYTFSIVAFWLLAMGWLIGTKVLPALQQGTPPDYRAEFVREAAGPPPPVAWELFWNEKPIGTSVSQAYTEAGEPAEFRSLVHFRQVAIGEVLREFLGGLSSFAAPLFGNDRTRVDATIATKLRLDWEGELDGFDTTVRAGDSTDLILLRGKRTEEDRLRLTVISGETTIDVPQEFSLPPKSRYAEAFSPRSQMQNLTVGQRWTMPVVNPLASSDAVRLVESLVESRETITWHDVPIETFLVVYRYDSGSGASARAPVGRSWVRDDGVILRQELPIGKAKVRFERITDELAHELGTVLEASKFEKYLHRRAEAN